ncbi:alpha/beta hydrolase [Cohnella lupini]|uniref:Alpha-beta hydrolase superfamily lysophospholipase n=1 Tax=Cohnella lupini TaxID=1294267 RepID=A0A3D9IX24_9BACL|nr:alpha/beta hydrolase [Cohnella lupini]RED66204.1 alpha-beta hydrolase superfamily lysophospholipase [Cohnella lupini]
MISNSMKWITADGTSMHAYEWSPEPSVEVKAVIGLVHGMGEHAARYSHVAEMLIEEGYAMIGFDQRGHGLTTGKRGHTPTYESLLEGIDLLLAEAERKYPGIPLFLYGHSMGGNVTLNYLLRKQPDIAGAIVTGPWLRLAFKPPTLQAVIGKIVEQFYPAFTNNRPLNSGNLTTDPAMIERYLNDELGHGQITARFFFSVQGAGKWALSNAAQLKVPLLLMHGGDDKVTSIHASKQFADRTSALAEWREWPDFKHELHNETRREEVFAVMRQWLEMKLK